MNFEIQCHYETLRKMDAGIFSRPVDIFFKIMLVALTIFAIMSGSSYAAEILLYDGAENTTPDEQEWFSNFSVSEVCGSCEQCATTPDILPDPRNFRTL